MRQRFTFRFWNAAEYQEAEIVIVGTHYDDAKSGAWAALGERTRDHNPRRSWRLVSTMQEPTWVWGWTRQREVAS